MIGRIGASLLLASTLYVGTGGMALAGEYDDAPIVTGEMWQQSARNSKLAFLLGAANVIEIEQALQADDPPDVNDSLVPVLVSGLKDMTMSELLDAVDAWYQENPGRLDRPVLETIWFEFALPNV